MTHTSYRPLDFVWNFNRGELSNLVILFMTLLSFISPYFGISGNNQSPNTLMVKATFPNLSGQLKTGQFVKSEIVIPLFVNGENIGQIDIDSNTPDPFTKEDETFLENINKEVANILG